MITVKGLMEKLQYFDSDMRVIVGGYEGGLCDIKSAKFVKINLNVNTNPVYGPHEEDGNGEAHAVYLEELTNE